MRFMVGNQTEDVCLIKLLIDMRGIVTLMVDDYHVLEIHPDGRVRRIPSVAGLGKLGFTIGPDTKLVIE
jgi:hypothetical protein